MAALSWRDRPLRMVRFDHIGAMLPADPQALEAHARLVADELHANFEWVMANPGAAPGLAHLANFQTERFAVNPAIGAGDPIRTYVPLAHARQITVFAYLNLHWYSYAFADQHPDWEQRLATGEGYGRVQPLYGNGTTLCVNSPWRDFAFAMIEEAMKTGIDGVFLDGPVVFPGCCYCGACRARFRELHGAEPPPAEDWREPRWRQFMRFREDSMAAFLAGARAAVQRVNPAGGVFCNAGNWAYGNAVARNPWVLERHQDLTGAEAFFHLRREAVPHVLDSAQAAKFLRAGRNPAVVFTHHCLGVWHYLGMPDLELRRAFYQVAACGASNWLAVFRPAWERQREKTFRTVRDTYGFLRAHEELYIGATSAARTALVHSQATSLAYLSPRAAARVEVHEQDLAMHVEGKTAADVTALKRACDSLCTDEFAGFFYCLTRNHVPFDVLRDADLQPEVLRRYDTVVLPNVACLEAGWCAALLDFARRGGTVLASFETGQFDADGEPAGGDFLRALFGIETVEGSMAPAAAEEYLEISPAGAAVFAGLAAGELVPRFRAVLRVRAVPAARALCHLMEPIGQVYAPLRPATAYPGILDHAVGAGRGVFFAGAFGESYHSFGFLEYEQLLGDLLHRLPGARPQIVTDAPATVQMELWRQGEQRWLLHLVNNSGDMRRPIARILPVPPLRLELPGVHAVRAASVQGAPLTLAPTAGGCTVHLELADQYDVVILETD